METQTSTTSDFHPFLRGGRRTTYSHGYSPSHILSCSVICETLIPSLPTETILIVSRENPPGKSLQSYYLASCAENPIPDEVADLIVRRGFKEVFFWLDGSVGYWEPD